MSFNAVTLPTKIPIINRAQLSGVFTDPKTLLAFEAQQGATLAAPGAINETSGVAVIGANLATAVSGASLVLLVAGPLNPDGTPVLPDASVLGGGTGVTLDTSTAGTVLVVVDALAILNALASIGFTAPVNASAGLECASLRIDQAPTATATASNYSVPVNINGTVMYLRLSSAP